MCYRANIYSTYIRVCVVYIYVFTMHSKQRHANVSKIRNDTTNNEIETWFSNSNQICRLSACPAISLCFQCIGIELKFKCWAYFFYFRLWMYGYLDRIWNVFACASHHISIKNRWPVEVISQEHWHCYWKHKQRGWLATVRACIIKYKIYRNNKISIIHMTLSSVKYIVELCKCAAP